jgi:hypothetical protein
MKKFASILFYGIAALMFIFGIIGLINEDVRQMVISVGIILLFITIIVGGIWLFGGIFSKPAKGM